MCCTEHRRKVDYRRMGNMERRLLVNTTILTTSMHQSRDLWKSPRGTMLRIQVLAVAAIIITFFLIAFGSCRRWSSRWIVQKGFLAAQVLSLSLGTYSIGLMQSSSVKSEMYPIWTVSLFTLFGCVDPVTSYNGLDYKGPLSKVIYGICLHCGYVVLMSISAISGVVGNTAIGVLSAITFIKGFHRSLALVQQRRMRNLVEEIKHDNYPRQATVLAYDFSTALERMGDDEFSGYVGLSLPARSVSNCLVVDFPTDTGNTDRDYVHLIQVDELLREKKVELQSCYNACAAYCLSHYLQRHFLGLSKTDDLYGETSLEVLGVEGCKRAFNVIEIELGFLYDIFFTGNAFLHYYQAKTASLWALASFTGICFVGIAAGTSAPSSTSSGGGGSTNSSFVDTTTADLVITFAILVSLALLQLLQLIRCWTSNWARVAVVCAYTRRSNDKDYSSWRAWWMSLKASVVTSGNWFDKFLWQEKMGQLSMLSPRTRPENKMKRGASGYRGCVLLVKVLGLDYIWEVLRDLFGNDTNKGDPVRLDDEVKAYVIDFLGKIESNRLYRNWKSFPHSPDIEAYLPKSYNESESQRELDHGYARKLRLWCIVTAHCEAAEKKKKKKKEEEKREKNRRVANALCNYCAYLVVSVPELLPGPVQKTREAYKRRADYPERDRLLAEKLLARSDCWETLAPYGSPEAHMRHLSQGGEFITHLWALLYHLGICEWKCPSNLRCVGTIDQAERILTEFSQGNKSTFNSFLEDGIAVFAYAIYEFDKNELVAASKLERYVSFYDISNANVAEFFYSGLANCPSLIMLKKEDDFKFTLYEGDFHAYAIAHFVSVNNKPRWTDSNEHEAEEQGRIQRGGLGGWSPLYLHVVHGVPPKPPLKISAMGEEEEEENEKEEEEKVRREKEEGKDEHPLVWNPGSATAEKESSEDEIEEEIPPQSLF